MIMNAIANLTAKLVCALAAATVLAGCGATPSQETPMNSSATLHPQRTVDIAPGTTLRYDGAADSRCPPDVQCITAGEINYQFTLTGAAGTEAFNLS